MLRGNEKLMNALKYLTGIFGWEDEDKQEIWAATKGSAEMVDYWIDLAEKWKRACGHEKENLI